MNMETVDRIEFMASRFTVVLITLRGLQSWFDGVQAQLGPWMAFVALASVGLLWFADIVRELLGPRPKLFVLITVISLAVVLVALMASPPPSVVTQPSSSTPRALPR